MSTNLPSGTVTFLFTDIEGSTQLWEQHPEAMGAALARHDTLLHTVIEANQGQVIKSTGDGLYAVFASAPDCLSAALASQRALRAEVWPVTGPLRVRMALHTGEAELREGDYFGPALNRTARLMAAGAGGQCLLSQATAAVMHDQLPPQVALRNLGEHRLKDLVRPERVYQVVAPDLPADFPPLRSLSVYTRSLPAPLTSFVGRHAQWQVLQTTWHEVSRGHAHFVLISGEAGIGKSRLAEEILAWAELQEIVTAHARAYAAEGRLSYAPVIEWLRTPALKAQMLQVGDSWLVELARLLPELLEERPGLPAPPPATESWQRHRFFEALARALLGDQQPLVLALDDLQWCDQETLEWLHFLLRFAPHARLLVLGTVRPEEIDMHHPLASLLTGLANDQQLTELELAALSAEDTVQLAQQVLGQALPLEQAARLYRDTEGYPLYVVETMRANLQGSPAQAAVAAAEGQPASSSALLPSKIRAVIDSRLTQLTPLARKVADLAAVIGRNFSYDVLARAGDSSEDELVEGLDELLARHLVRERDAGGYDFSHDRLREAVYGKVSTTRRRVLHRRIAEALASVHAANLDQASSHIAAHYEQAGLTGLAVPAYVRAAQAAFRVYAHAEAIDLYQKALALLATLPVDETQHRQELAILMPLGSVLVGMRGYAGLQVDEVYLRAQHLTQDLGEPPNPAILRGLAIFYLVRRAFAQTRECGEQILALADQAGEQADAVLLVEGHYVLGVHAFWLGQFATSREQLEAGLAHYDRCQHTLHTTIYAQDPGVVCLIRLAHVLWYLGYPEQAQQRCHQALALARQFDHPYTLAYALTFAAWLSNVSRDRATTSIFTTELLVCCQQYGFQYWTPKGLILRGQLLAERGEIEAGLADVRAGMLAYQNARIELYQSYSLATIAQIYAMDGTPEQGLAALDEALASVGEYGDRWYEAEILRLKGELTAATGAGEDMVESYFRQALSLAQQQQAKSLELRVSLSLARLWAQQGRRREAYTLLSGVYTWFTEGFDTPDLQEAKACLDGLA